MKHTHRFSRKGEGTTMVDIFEFTSPFGLLGKLADFLFLEKYMTHFLILRNMELKNIAEGDNWNSFIKEHRK